MHSFRQSRGRIFFEVLCALAISASLVGTWMQTGASALLPAAAVALLYGLVHMLDMAGRRSGAPNPESVEIAPHLRADATTEFPAPMVASEQPATDDPVPDVADLTEQAHPARKGRPPKAPRKAGTRRAGTKAKAQAKVAELVPATEAKVVPDEEPAAVVPMPLDEAAHASFAPLFEPEPFVRQQRAVFGRKAG